MEYTFQLKKKRNSAICNNMEEPEDGFKVTHRKTDIACISLHDISKIIKLIDEKSGIVVSRD